MVSAIVVEPLTLPEMPVTVTVAVPTTAELLPVKVSMLLGLLFEVEFTLAGLNDAVTPLGRPDADKLTVPPKPFNGATVIVHCPLDDCAMVRLLADEERVMPGDPTMKPLSALISCCPVGVPTPVTKSYPMTAGLPLLPVAMSCRHEA